MTCAKTVAWTAGLLTLLAAGCGRGQPQERTSGIGPLDLSVSDEVTLETVQQADPSRPRVTRIRAPAPDGPGAWRVLPPESDAGIAPVEDGYTRQATGVARVRVPGPFVLGSFTKLIIESRHPFPVRCLVRCVRGKRVLARSDLTVLGNTGTGTRRDLIELELGGSQGEPFQAIEIVIRPFGDTDQPWGIDGVDLLEVSDELPPPGLEPELIVVAEDARLGYGLFQGVPLAGAVQVPAAGAVLSFSYACPARLARDALGSSLVVRVGKTESRFPLDDFEGLKGWARGELSLEPWAGRRVPIRFEIQRGNAERPVCALAEVRMHVPDPDPRTVLLITSDTHRGDHLGAAGRGVDLRTPALDRLAAEGVFFEDCFSTTNVTTPSHTAIMTGISPRDTLVLGNDDVVSERALTLAECFREAGWLTWSAVSAGFLGAESGLGQGFERMVSPMPEAPDSRVNVGTLLEWLPAAEGQSLFVWLHVFDAHTPYEPPQELERLYYPADRDPSDPSLPKRSFPGPYLLKGVRDIEWPKALYASEITYLDTQLEKLLTHPRVRGGTTCVTADHGESLGQHGIYWSHTGLYPDSIHVPLILRSPTLPAGTRVSAPVQNLGVGRTLLDLAGLADMAFPGENVVKAIEAVDGPARTRLSLSANAQTASITEGAWHLIMHLRRYTGPGLGDEFRSVRHGVELYDRSTDPDCLTDRAGAEPDRARRLRARLVEWLLTAPSEGLAGNRRSDTELRKRLAALGYTVDAESFRDESLYERDCECEQCLRFR